MSTTDIFTGTSFEHPINEKTASTNGKNTSEANEKKNQKKKKDNCNGITNKNKNNGNRNNKSKTNVYILGDSMVKN